LARRCCRHHAVGSYARFWRHGPCFPNLLKPNGVPSFHRVHGQRLKPYAGEPPCEAERAGWTTGPLRPPFSVSDTVIRPHDGPPSQPLAVLFFRGVLPLPQARPRADDPRKVRRPTGVLGPPGRLSHPPPPPRPPPLDARHMNGSSTFPTVPRSRKPGPRGVGTFTIRFHPPSWGAEKRNGSPRLPARGPLFKSSGGRGGPRQPSPAPHRPGHPHDAGRRFANHLNAAWPVLPRETKGIPPPRSVGAGGPPCGDKPERNCGLLAR